MVWAVRDGSAEQLATGLSAPEGLAVDGDHLLVVEEGLDRVSAIDRTTGAVTTVINGLDLGSPVIPGALPHGIFNGVAVGPNGSIYVSDDGANAVYKFKKSNRRDDIRLGGSVRRGGHHPWGYADTVRQQLSTQAAAAVV